jgi:2-aminoadipate transaminase
MQIEIDRSSAQPLYQQLASSIQQRIRNGAFPPGMRLPTVRQLAEQLGITRLTAHSAYAELASGGWVEATVGRGTFVAELDNALRMPPISELDQEVSPRGVLHDILRMAQMPGICTLAMSDPAPEWYPMREWQRAVDETLSLYGASVMSYSTGQGDSELRAVLAYHLHDRGFTVGPDEIMITNGVTQALGVVAKILACPGDTVLVEQPTYLGTINSLITHGYQPVGIPLDEEGILPDALEHAICQHKPAFLYTIPTFQNPTGVCLSPQRRRAILEIAQRHNLTIVEDDIYGRISLEGSPPPSLKSEDFTGNVIHLGGFSKSLMPGLRVGYIVAPPSFLRQAVTVRQAQDLCSPLFVQRTLANFISHGWHTAHIRRVLPRYRERRDALLRAMEQHFPADVFWTRPRGGFACWVTLPPSISVTEVYLAAIERGVAFAPGEVFCASPSNRSEFRLSFSTQSPSNINNAIATLGELLRERSHRRNLPVPTSNDCLPIV